jgi:tetratricopeptide (TPR) repeat protein
MKAQFALIAFLLFVAPLALAEVSEEVSDSGATDSISELSRKGNHFAAISKLIENDTNLNLADQLAAANSAWALGLVHRARALWDVALANKDFQDDERYRATLARSIVELQESNFEEARAIAERAAAALPESELRGQFWLVIAEALKEQKAFSLAEEYYSKAIRDGDKSLQNEARFLLGECQLKLGRMSDSRYSFASVESGTQYTEQALKRLVEIDLSQKNFEGVLTWIAEGRDSYPSDFRDGWTSYSRITALSELGREEDARAELQAYKVRRSEKDSWYPLAEAAVEAKFVRAMLTDESVNLISKSETEKQ